LIRVHDLTFSYREGFPALDGVHLEVAAGESVGIIGPNGAGKTTLLLCLAGVLPIPPGRIQIAGLDPAKASDRQRLPAHVGIVFQNSDDQIIHATVEEDIAFGPLNLGWPEAKVCDAVADAIHQLGLTGLKERSPYQLSGGEKRRAALAGVLAMQPHVYLLDEPSMFLDPRTRRELIGFLNDLNQTKVIAGHDLDLVWRVCRRVVLMDAGRIKADGPTESILRDARLLEPLGLEVPYQLRLRRDGASSWTPSLGSGGESRLT
jgi:cobalt/nickel transport system ATP-binding protein